MKRHLIGIGGVGMSALATALVRLGDEVTGADRNLDTPNIRFLESLGIRCFPDDGSGIDASTGEVIVSTAIEDTNPGLARAKEFGIPVAFVCTGEGYDDIQPFDPDSYTDEFLGL